MQRAMLIGAVALAQFSAAGQTPSAREIFYDPSGLDTPVKPKNSSKPKLPSTRTLPSLNTSKPQAPTEQVAVTAAESQISAPRSDVASVTLVSTGTRPLGLKYTVMKRESPGHYVEVKPDIDFVAGDHIRIAVQVNDSGYLYVISKGTSGVWKVLFPSPEVDNGDNRVKFGRSYDIPAPGASFAFDNRSGGEKLFLVLSRQPVSDLESVIYSLQDKQPEKNGELSRPMMASNIAPIQDGVVEQLQTYKRDLVIEKVDDSSEPPSDKVKKLEQPGGPIPPEGEKAVYVVNPNAGADGRVVADLELKHQ